MSDDKQTTESEEAKEVKFPADAQRQKTLSEEIEGVWCGLEANLCQEIRKAGLELADILGNRHYQN